MFHPRVPTTVSAAVATAFVILLGHMPMALADVCAQDPVTARGENSRLVWTAKTKARANWRRKVRLMPELGPDYANWSRAEMTDERCLTGPVGTVCIFSGKPCKPSK